MSSLPLPADIAPVDTRQEPATTMLLSANEPPPVTVEQPQGISDFMLACDHASRRLPRALGTLGLSESELCSHIAWDLGAASVARRLAARLDAILVMQNYSRLVIDCNRPPRTLDSIPSRSEAVRIAGNENLPPHQTAARIAEIFAPYHDRLRSILDHRQAQGRQTLLVAVHSFTPTYHGISRPWHIGVMYRRDVRTGSALVKELRTDASLCVGDNEPYAIEDGIDYTIPLHGESRGIVHAGLEIRQDLIADDTGQNLWAGRLATWLTQWAQTLAG